MKKDLHVQLAAMNVAVREVIDLSKNAAKNTIDSYKKGDVIACFAGRPYPELCVVELTTDDVNLDHIDESISGKSLLPLTSHLVSSNWFKVK